jgi:hypothetical protein
MWTKTAHAQVVAPDVQIKFHLDLELASVSNARVQYKPQQHHFCIMSVGLTPNSSHPKYFVKIHFMPSLCMTGNTE